jgi:glucosylceramidase
VLFWNLALDEKHGPHLGGCGNCRGVVTIDSKSGAVTRNDEYYVLAHASQFVRQVARRITSSSGVAGVESVAFKNPDGSIVLVLANTANDERRFGVAWRRKALAYTLPGGGVATLRWR